MEVFEPLAAWQRKTGKSDAEVARLLTELGHPCSRWKITRAKKGEQKLPIEDQLALEKFTGIKPEQWTAFHVKLARQQTRTTQKKSLVAEGAH